MSLKIAPHTNKITNANNQTVFKFPSNTVLDNILPDVWVKIIEYYHHDIPFIISTTKHPSIEYEEITYTKGFENLFFDYYKNNGKIPILNNLNCDRMQRIIVGQNYLVSTDDKSVYGKIENGLVEFFIFIGSTIQNFECEEIKILPINNGICYQPLSLTLFIKKGIKLY